MSRARFHRRKRQIQVHWKTCKTSTAHSRSCQVMASMLKHHKTSKVRRHSVMVTRAGVAGNIVESGHAPKGDPKLSARSLNNRGVVVTALICRSTASRKYSYT